MPLLVPADSVASLATPVMVIETTSSASCGVIVIGRATAPPSFTVIDAAVPVRLGGSGAGVEKEVL